MKRTMHMPAAILLAAMVMATVAFGTATSSYGPNFLNGMQLSGHTSDNVLKWCREVEAIIDGAGITSLWEAGDVNSIMASSGTIVVEGATKDAYETTISFAEPVADNAVMFAAASGTVMLSSLATNAADVANSVTGGTNQLIFEGSSADAHEAIITATNPTADTIWTLPVAAAGTYSLVSSTLATNAPDVANSVTGGTNQLIFEGSGVDAYEAIITATNPTADTIWTLPVAAAGTYSLVSSTLATNAPDVANSVTGGTNQLIFEGATADAYETILTPTDATADRTVTFPDRSGSVRVNAVAVLTPTATPTYNLSTGTVFTLSPTDNEDETITGTGFDTIPGATVTIVVTSIGASADEVLTFGTGFKTSGTLTISGTTGKVMTITFVSDGTQWVEVSRTAAM